MNTTQLRLEIVTPMFLRGSDNETPELRPPAFKALFRYWWRAAIGETNLNTLREKEGNLFGNTKGRSPLSIRIHGGVAPLSGEYAPLPHDPGRFQSQALSPNGSFNLTLTAPDLTEYERIAKMGFLLGGVGNRSRRGFGSMRYQNWNFQNIDELQNEVYQTLDQISPGEFRQSHRRIDKNPTVSIPDYPVILNIYFGDTLSANSEILRRIGQAMHKYSDDALGGINPRMASPVHVRIQKVNDQFVPIVTQLHSVFPAGPPARYTTIQQNFIDAIIT